MSVVPATRRGRPRSEASERAILDAALELMAVGSRPVTITEIARRAGVGKDTVYRRWRSKDDLLLDALATLPGPLGEYADGPIRDVLIARLTELIERMHDDRNQRIYRSVLGGSTSLRERFFAELIERRRAATCAVIAAAVRRGELRADTDAALLGALLFSPVLAETLEGRPRPALRGAPQAVATRLVDAALRGARPQLPD